MANVPVYKGGQVFDAKMASATVGQMVVLAPATTDEPGRPTVADPSAGGPVTGVIVATGDATASAVRLWVGPGMCQVEGGHTGSAGDKFESDATGTTRAVATPTAATEAGELLEDSTDGTLAWAFFPGENQRT